MMRLRHRRRWTLDTGHSLQDIIDQYTFLVAIIQHSIHIKSESCLNDFVFPMCYLPSHILITNHLLYRTQIINIFTPYQSSIRSNPTPPT